VRRLVIGVGHPDRGDDDAGRAVARLLKARALPEDVSVIETDGEAGKLIDLFGDADVAVLVDAGLSGTAAPGTIHRIDAHTEDLPRPMFAMSSHAIGLVESVELARTLDVLPARCIVVAIEAKTFELGAGMSPEVAAVLEQAACVVLKELGVSVDA